MLVSKICQSTRVNTDRSGQTLLTRSALRQIITQFVLDVKFQLATPSNSKFGSSIEMQPSRMTDFLHRAPTCGLKMAFHRDITVRARQ